MSTFYSLFSVGPEIEGKTSCLAVE